MIGGGPKKDHKFVGKLISQIKSGSGKLLAVDDKFGTITYARGLADFIKRCAHQRSTSLFHFTGQGIAKVVSKHYGRRILFVAMILLVVANTINVGADLGAMVAATRLLIPAPFLALLAFFALGVLALELFIPYHVYAQILKVLALALLAYVITGVIVSPDWGSLLLTTLIPSFSLTPPFLALVVGVLGTTISPYLFFWQAAEEVEETRDQQQEQKKHKGAASRPGLRARIRSLRIDTVLGMLASEVTTWFILMTTGVTLHDAHPPITNITTAAQAAQALTPLVHTFPHAGQLAASIFAIGIIGTGLLAVPVLAGSAAYGVAEALGWSEGLDKPVNQARGFYGVIAAATLVGLLLNLLGVNPIAALVFTAILNGVVAVPLLILIVLVANNRKIMGRWTNNRLSNTIVIITTLFMALAAIFSIVTLF